jgi:hypothetical protein
MFDEQETTAGFENPAHFVKRTLDRGNAAHGPRRHHGVDDLVVNGNSFGSALDELKRGRCSACRAAGHFQQLSRGFDADDLTHGGAIEGQVETGTDADPANEVDERNDRIDVADAFGVRAG